MKLVIATRNSGKLEEIRYLLRSLPIDLLSAEEVNLPEIPETGSTFTENALLKAEAALKYTGLPSLGEDSGLEIDALGGAPGVFSSRYGRTDLERIQRVLEEMELVPEHRRTARFRCVVALAFPHQPIKVVEGILEGRILHEARGAYGFGYDPIFFIPEYQATLAELPPEVKNCISHRARAFEEVRRVLEEKISPIR